MINKGLTVVSGQVGSSLFTVEEGQSEEEEEVLKGKVQLEEFVYHNT